MTGFDSVSGYYDLLARLVFGRKLEQATRVNLYRLTPGSEILIPGGGTGRILEWLDQLQIPLRVTYLEFSESMLQKSKARLPLANLDVRFIQADAVSWNPDRKFNAVISAFFLDCLSTEQLLQIKEHWYPMMARGSSWFFIDFVRTKPWYQRTLVWIMYRFFHHMAGLNQRTLPDYSKVFGDREPETESVFMGGLVVSRIYRIS